MPYGTLYAPKKTYMGSTQQPYSPWGLAFKNTHQRTIDRESHRAIENNPRGREDKRLSATVSLGWRRLKQTKKSPKKKRKKQSTTPPLYTTVSCTPLASLSLSLPPQIQQDRRGEHSPHAVKRPLSLHPPPPTSPKTSTSTAKFAKEFKHSKGHGCRRGAPPLNRHAAGSRRRVPAFFRSRPPPSPSLGNGLLPPSLPVGAATRLSIAGWLASCSVMLISGRGVLCRLLGLGELVHADL